MIRKRKYIDAKDYLLSSIKKSKGCWEWLRYKNKAGYGVACVYKKRFLAHRLSYEVFNGEFEPDLYVCHKCDNPSCTNPKHLFLGSAADNTDDMHQKRRHRHADNHHNSKLNSKQVKEILNNPRVPSVFFAREFNVSKNTIAHIRKGRTWRILP